MRYPINTTHETTKRGETITVLSSFGLLVIGMVGACLGNDVDSKNTESRFPAMLVSSAFCRFHIYASRARSSTNKACRISRSLLSGHSEIHNPTIHAGFRIDRSM